MAKPTEEDISFGDVVRKVGGDYQFNGVVVSAFQKLSGVWRYVVEDDRGILHIFSGKNLQRYERQKQKRRTRNRSKAT